jgi:chromosome segregation ATPase
VRSAYPDSSDGEDKEINALNTQLDKLKHEHFELSFELNDLENAFGKIGSGGEASGGHGEEAKRFEASQKRIDELRIERKNVESRMNQLEESIQKAKDSQAKAF